MALAALVVFVSDKNGAFRRSVLHNSDDLGAGGTCRGDKRSENWLSGGGCSVIRSTFSECFELALLASTASGGIELLNVAFVLVDVLSTFSTTKPLIKMSKFLSLDVFNYVVVLL